MDFIAEGDTPSKPVNNNPDIYEEEQIAELEICDDWGSAWEICKEMGLKWGGRGAGGRATNRCSVQPYDVVVEGCTMAYLGTNLLDRTTLRLLQGRKYGLIGRNGVGKSTLMRRIASGTLPGFPQHIRVAQVRQELPYLSPEDSATMTPVQYVVNYNPVRRQLLRKIEQLEGGDYTEEADSDGEEVDPEAQAELLCNLYEFLEEEGVASARAITILRDLGFGEKRRGQPMGSLSGGWRMRASIACALAQEPDILLLDEPTNHLDLEGVEWLQSYLTSAATENLTVLITSHDSNFLDNVCTDIIRFFQRQLTYYPGSYSDFESIKHDKDLMTARQQASLDKERKHIEDTIRRMQVAAHKDTSGKANGAIASRKKKLARHGLEKNSKGHRFRVQHEATDGRSMQRIGSRNATAMGYKTGQSASLIEAAEREWSMTIPNPVPLSTMAPMLQIRDATLGYRTTPTTPNNDQTSPVDSNTSKQDPSPSSTTNASTGPGPVVTSVSHLKSIGSKSCKKKPVSTVEEEVVDATVVLEHITLDLQQGAKIAIVGKNGAGKSTLLKLLTEYGEQRDIDSRSPVVIRGEVYKNPAMRIAYYQQLQQESLPYAESPLQHLTAIAPEGYNEQSLRAHLGAFGLGGDLALQPIGVLSGGQKSRVVFAELTLNKPQLLLLDEPTNNLDLDAIRALKEAMQVFTGACIITSHDMAFVDGVASVVYHLNNKRLTRLEGGVGEYKALVRETVSRQKRNRS